MRVGAGSPGIGWVLPGESPGHPRGASGPSRRSGNTLVVLRSLAEHSRDLP